MNWFKHPVAIASLLSILVFLLIQPYGDFPLNDDWQYTHVAKQLADTGNLKIDAPIAPSIVLQSFLGAAWIKVFGFSHFKLRLLSFLMSLVFFVAINGVMREIKITRRWRVAALILLSFNPLFLHFQLSFLTELYGYTLQIVGLWLWLVSKRKSNFRLEVLAITLIAATFWVRQFCVLVLPALFLSELKFGKSSLRFYMRWLGHFILSFLVISSYFYWSAATGNAKPQFSLPLARLLRPDFGLWLTHMYLFSMYSLLFFLPLLVHLFSDLKTRLNRKFWTFPVLLYLACCIYVGHRWLIKGGSGYFPKSSFNHQMPYLGNVLSPFGVGPITTTDIYFEQRLDLLSQNNSWSTLWLLVTVGLFLLLPFLVVLMRQIHYSAKGRVPADGTAQSTFSVPLLLGSSIVINLVFAVQAYGAAVFDRYYFPALFSALILIAYTLKDKKLNWITLVSTGCLFWFYSVLGVYDYFRWNEGRAELVSYARKTGILSLLDAGFEPNGWLHYEEQRPHCGPSEEFFCTRLPYQIAWSKLESSELIQKSLLRAFYLTILL